MEKIERLKEIISSYWQVDPDESGWETRFDGQIKTFTSLRMLRFFASIEDRFQVEIEDPDAILTFADLRRTVLS